jgi:hypothetical protein
VFRIVHGREHPVRAVLRAQCEGWLEEEEEEEEEGEKKKKKKKHTTFIWFVTP